MHTEIYMIPAVDVPLLHGTAIRQGATAVILHSLATHHLRRLNNGAESLPRGVPAATRSAPREFVIVPGDTRPARHREGICLRAYIVVEHALMSVDPGVRRAGLALGVRHPGLVLCTAIRTPAASPSGLGACGTNRNDGAEQKKSNAQDLCRGAQHFLHALLGEDQCVWYTAGWGGWPYCMPTHRIAALAQCPRLMRVEVTVGLGEMSIIW